MDLCRRAGVRNHFKRVFDLQIEHTANLSDTLQKGQVTLNRLTGMNRYMK